MNIYYPTIEEFDKSFPGLGQEMILEVPSKKELFSVNCGENHFNYKHGKLIGAKNNPEIQRRYEESPERKATRKKYKESPEGKATQKKYEESPEGKAAQKKYIQSPKGKVAQKKAQKKYKESPEGKAVLKKYKESPEGKAVLKKVRKKYNQSPKGKATQKKMIAKNIAETGYADRRSAPDGSRASKRKERDGRVRKSRKTPSPVYLRVND